MNTLIHHLDIEIYADGAVLSQISRLGDDPMIKGFTTNPTLIKNAMLAKEATYAEFASAFLKHAGGKPVSFEVVADDLAGMDREARVIASWGENVYVKIPITNTLGESTLPVIHRLSADGIKVNVTAVMTSKQAESSVGVLDYGTPAIISLFAGRIADTGFDPHLMVYRLALLIKDERPLAKLLWASPRGVLDIFRADRAGAHIITVTPEILAKLPLIGKDLDEYSLETVRQFRSDAVAAGLTV